MNTAFDMLLEFDEQGAKFARGFECGRVWTLLREYPASEITETAHARNAEMFIRMAEATDRPFSSVDVSEDHIEVTFGEARS